MSPIMSRLQNDTENYQLQAPGPHMELYSIVLSATMLFLAILFGGGGCATVLIAMCARKLLRKLRYTLMAILLVVCCLFDFIWCPIEITRLVLHHQNSNRSVTPEHIIVNLKHAGGSLYMLFLCGLGAIVVLICVQNLLKQVHKYDAIPKVKFGIIVIVLWLILTVSLTIAFVITCLLQEDDGVYHSINRMSFHFKIGVETMWIVLLLAPLVLMVILHLHTKFWNDDFSREMSDLHSNENFTVPSLIIKSVEEIAEEDDEENSVALPSPDIHRDSIGGSPESKCSKSALKKRSGSPSSQKVLFAENPSPTRANNSSNLGEKFKSQNHLGVNMSAILGRRRHTIAQITDPQLDLIQKAKSYNYVRKFSVDISALQAQLENPKLHGSFPFHSQQDIKKDSSDSKLQPLTFNLPPKRKSHEEIIKSQEIIEEPENEQEHDPDNEQSIDQQESGNDMKYDKEEHSKTSCNKVENSDRKHSIPESVHSRNTSIRSGRSARDSVCPTPPLISLTQSDGEEKQLELNNSDNNMDNTFVCHKNSSIKQCKLPFLLVLTYILSILPLFLTELLRDAGLENSGYINIVTVTTAISMVQTMIYPQLIFCVDSRINKAVHRSFVKTRRWMTSLVSRQHEIPTSEEFSDTEV